MGASNVPSARVIEKTMPMERTPSQMKARKYAPATLNIEELRCVRSSPEFERRTEVMWYAAVMTKAPGMVHKAGVIGRTKAPSIRMAVEMSREMQVKRKNGWGSVLMTSAWQKGARE